VKPDFDLTDDELLAAGGAKWVMAGPGVLPAWVAEMDVRPCPPVRDALIAAVDAGTMGYPPKDHLTALPAATAAHLRERFGWDVDPDRVVLTGDVMAGVELVLRTLCEPAPVVVPVPSYPPFLDVVPLTGREMVLVPCVRGVGPDGAPRHVLDLAGIETALAAGARTILLASPFNPLGRCFDVEELAGIRDAAVRHGARVVSDEIHAQLVLPGGRHVPYASLPGTAEHVTTLVAASKAWNLPGLKCAQVIPGNDADLARLRALPLIANHGTSMLGIVAATAAYTAGQEWLDGLVAHLAEMRDLFGRLVAQRLPGAEWLAPEATYLTWLDARATGLRDPAATALERGKVMVNQGRTFGPGYEQCVRVNLATSAERLERIVDRLALAWS
jgi:cystathionine beta-lyase